MTVHQMILKLKEYERVYGGDVLITILAPDEFNDGKPVETPAKIAEYKDARGEFLSLMVVETAS
jgi:hypothetical protein